MFDMLIVKFLGSVKTWRSAPRSILQKSWRGGTMERTNCPLLCSTAASLTAYMISNQLDIIEILEIIKPLVMVKIECNGICSHQWTHFVKCHLHFACTRDWSLSFNPEWLVKHFWVWTWLTHIPHEYFAEPMIIHRSGKVQGWYIWRAASMFFSHGLRPHGGS